MIAGLFILTGAVRGQTMDLNKILSDFSSLDFLYQPVPFKTAMISTADPNGTNMDWDNFIQQDEQKALLADIAGPGIITRVFCARPKGIIKIYLDGNPAPMIAAPVSDFFAGKLPPFTAPLVGADPAAFSYFPIPFGKRARIEIEASPGDQSEDRFGWFWQVEHVEIPETYQVKSLSLPLTAQENAALEKLKTFLVGLEKFEAPAGVKHQSFDASLFSGKDSIIFELKGPAVIRKIQLELFTKQKNGLDVLLQQGLVCYWDGEERPSISARVGDFFGNSFNQRSPKILARRSKNGGESLIPMPFADSARCQIYSNESGGQARVEVWYEPLPSLNTPLRFHALEREQKLKKSPEKLNRDHKNDYLVLDAKGQGRYLGTSLTVLNRYLIWWGEGDESFFIDGKPAWLGTGSEDYFDGAYMKFGTNLFSGALLQNSFGKKYGGITLAWRFHLLDPVYFRENLKFGFEHGNQANDMDNWYRSVAYWYQSEPHKNFSAMVGDQLDFSPKTVKAEVEKEIWRAMPLKNKILFFSVWTAVIGLVLLLMFLVLFRIWERNLKKGGMRL